MFNGIICHIMNIGVLYICLGAYDFFWKDFYLSSEKFFMQEDVKTYYVFTDAATLYGEENNPRIMRIPYKNMGWPDNTLMRFNLFLSIRERLERETDYLFFFNANMNFMAPVGKEILPEKKDNYLVGVQHIWYTNKLPYEFPYERRKISTACINYFSGKIYYQGSLIGGRTKEFLVMSDVLDKNIAVDKQKNFIAIWHDESHINRYFLQCKPKTLSPDYNYDENYSADNFIYKPVILNRNKAKLISYKKLNRPTYDEIGTLPLPWILHFVDKLIRKIKRFKYNLMHKICG